MANVATQLSIKLPCYAAYSSHNNQNAIIHHICIFSMIECITYQVKAFYAVSDMQWFTQFR